MGKPISSQVEPTKWVMESCELTSSRRLLEEYSFTVDLSDASFIVTRFAGLCGLFDRPHGFADSPVATLRHPFGIRTQKLARQ